MTTNALNFDALPDSAFARQAHLIPAVVPVSHATLWRMVKAKRFPAPVKLGPNITAWKVGDVRAWLEQAAKGAAQ